MERLTGSRRLALLAANVVSFTLSRSLLLAGGGWPAWLGLVGSAVGLAMVIARPYVWGRS